jgi:hypothetical protein
MATILEQVLCLDALAGSLLDNREGMAAVGREFTDRSTGNVSVEA